MSGNENLGVPVEKIDLAFQMEIQIKHFWRPALEDALEFKKVTKAMVAVNRVKDEMHLSGFGMMKDSVMFTQRALPNVLKLSENKKWEKIIEKSIIRNIKNFKQWNLAFFQVDYDTDTLSCELHYTDNENKNYKKLFKTKF